MRTKGFNRLVSKLLSIYLIFSISGCGQSMTGGSTGSSTQSASAPEADTELQDDRSALKQEIKNRTLQIVRGSQVVTQELSFLILITKSNGTRSTGQWDHPALEKKLYKVESDFQEWKKNVEAYLAISGDEFKESFKDLDQKLILIGRYFTDYSNLVFAHSLVQKETNSEWLSRFALKIPLKTFAQLSGFLKTDGYFNFDIVQPPIYGTRLEQTAMQASAMAAGKALSKAQGLDFSPIVVDVKMSGISRSFSFLKENNDAIYLQLGNEILSKISKNALSYEVTEETIISMMKYISVVELYKRYGKNSRYLPEPPSEFPKVPGPIAQEFPYLEKLDQATLADELQSFEVFTRQALKQSFEYYQRPKKVVIESADSQKVTPLSPRGIFDSEPLDEQRYGTNIFTQLKALEASGSSNLVESALSTAMPTNSVVSTNAHQDITTGITNAISAVSTNTPPVATEEDPFADVDSVVVTQPWENTNTLKIPFVFAPTNQNLTAPQNEAAKPAVAAPPIPNPVELAFKKYQEKQKEKNLCYLNEQFYKQLLDIINSSKDAEKTAKFLSNKDKMFSMMEHDEHENLGLVLNDVLDKWPLPVTSKDSAEWVASLRTILAKAKHDTLEPSFNSASIPADVAGKIAQLRSERALAYADEISPEAIQEWIAKARKISTTSGWSDRRKAFVKELIYDSIKVQFFKRNPDAEIDVDYAVLYETLSPYLTAAGAQDSVHNWVKLIVASPSVDAARGVHAKVMEKLLSELFPGKGIRFNQGNFIDHQGASTKDLNARMDAEIFLKGKKFIEPTTSEGRKKEAIRMQVVFLHKVGELFGYYNPLLTGKEATLADLPLAEAQKQLYRKKLAHKIMNRSVLAVRAGWTRLYGDLLSDRLFGLVYPDLGSKDPVPTAKDPILPEHVDAALPMVDVAVERLQENIKSDLTAVSEAKSASQVVSLLGESTLVESILQKESPMLASVEAAMLEGVIKKLRDPSLFRKSYKTFMHPAASVKVLGIDPAGWMGMFFISYLAASSVEFAGNLWRPLGVLTKVFPARYLLSGMSAPWMRISPYVAGYFLAQTPFFVAETGVLVYETFQKGSEQEQIKEFFQTSVSADSFYHYDSMLEAEGQFKGKIKETAIYAASIPILLSAAWGAARVRGLMLKNEFKNWDETLTQMNYQGEPLNVDQIISHAAEFRKTLSTAELAAFNRNVLKLTDGINKYRTQYDNTIRSLRNDRSRIRKEDHFDNLGIKQGQETLNPDEIDLFLKEALREIDLLKVKNPNQIAALNSKAKQIMRSAEKIKATAESQMGMMDAGMAGISEGDAAISGKVSMQHQLFDQYFLRGWRKGQNIANAASAEEIAQFRAVTLNYFKILGLTPETATREAVIAARESAMTHEVRLAYAKSNPGEITQYAQIEEAAKVLSNPRSLNAYLPRWRQLNAVGGAP